MASFAVELRDVSKSFGHVVALHGVDLGIYLGRQLTTPPSLHVVLTPIHARVVDDFLGDLREVAVAVARAGRAGEARSSYAT